MMKSSFAVGFQLNRKTTVVRGVTSIVPNLNGILLFVENGEHVQIEAHELVDGVLPNMFIDYSTDDGDFDPDMYKVVDCRR